MLDTSLLRSDIDFVRDTLSTRQYHLDVNTYSLLENQRKTLQTKTQVLQSQRNDFSKKIGLLKSKGLDASAELDAVSSISENIKSLKKELDMLLISLNDFMLDIPNLPHNSVPEGFDESANVEVFRYGSPTQFDFKVLDHVSLGEALDGLDFELGSQLSMSRFVVKKGKIARLYRALSQFMLDLHVDVNGYQECVVPYLVNEKSLLGTSQLPKFSEDLFFSELNNQDVKRKLGLIPTSEVPLTNFAADQYYSLDDLPIKLTACTPCFRSEAGSYGRDTRGLMRLHQFDKVEMVQLVEASQSYTVLEEMRLHAESILEALKLPYRTMLLCTGDMGFAASKTYDLEVWVPSLNTYREISSISNCESFQARRMQARYKNEKGERAYIHTLNGSGLALGRTLLAVMENYQQADGSILVPSVLVPYMNGLDVIR